MQASGRFPGAPGLCAVVRLCTSVCVHGREGRVFVCVFLGVSLGCQRRPGTPWGRGELTSGGSQKRWGKAESVRLMGTEGLGLQPSQEILCTLN